MPQKYSPIGVFDSGYGGLTILKGLRQALPECDYLYLGDNARAPYGTRSFDIVYEYTLQAVRHLFANNCPLVILACNTASAKALRTIQQHDLPGSPWPERRVLGVIRPTVEVLPGISRSKHIGVLATPGTIASHSYKIEIGNLSPELTVTEKAAPMWVPLVENRESAGSGADYFVKKYIDELFSVDPAIDTVVLACTHYPLLIDKIKQYLPEGVTLLSQGELTGRSLADYMRRHPDMYARVSKGGGVQFLTTENADKFNEAAITFTGYDIKSTHIEL
ncbi:MAG: glutamate racemase [Prevotella sp.]|nr:glutamate racemase [Prevotella sp.]MCM1074243.1 glutamate racemase [Ruminococcus sp.]